MSDIRITDKDGLVLLVDRHTEYLRSRIRMEHTIADVAEKLTTPKAPVTENYTLKDKMDDEYCNDPKSFMDEDELGPDDPNDEHRTY